MGASLAWLSYVASCALGLTESREAKLTAEPGAQRSGVRYERKGSSHVTCSFKARNPEQETEAAVPPAGQPQSPQGLVTWRCRGSRESHRTGYSKSSRTILRVNSLCFFLRKKRKEIRPILSFHFENFYLHTSNHFLLFH